MGLSKIFSTHYIDLNQDLEDSNRKMVISVGTLGLLAHHKRNNLPEFIFSDRVSQLQFTVTRETLWSSRYSMYPENGAEFLIVPSRFTPRRYHLEDSSAGNLFLRNQAAQVAAV